MPTRLLALILALLAPLALAAPPSVQKRLDKRLEVDTVLEKLVSGESVPSTVSRLRFLGEEEYAADQLTLLLRKAVEPRQRRNLAGTLAGLATRATEPTLLALTRDEDSTVRMYAAQGLARVRTRRADALLPLLEDKSSGVRKEAARALGLTRNPKVGKVLLEAAQAETEIEVRAVMLVAAGEAGDKKLAPALKAFLTSDSESSRFAAARGLCLLGAPEGFEFAGKLLASQDRYVRRQGLQLYEGVAAKKAAATLQPLLEDKDRGLAAAAARVLYQGGDGKMLDWLVLASWNAKSTEEKLLYEKEIEPLQLADDKRKAILRKAGMVK
jgi:HEAT repeat protein